MMNSNYEQAIARLRALHAPAVCSGEPDINLREAELFRRILAEIPIGGDPRRSRLAGIFGDSEDSSAPEPAASSAAQAPANRFDELCRNLQCSCSISVNHTTLDYASVLEHGLLALAEEAPNQAQRTALLAVAEFAERYARLGFGLCRRSPAYPAETFAEALQSILLVQAVTGIAEYGFASISLGRFDQYCYRYFENDRNRGVSEEELAAALREFMQMLNIHGDYAKALNIGGCDGAGNDQFNDLSRLILRVAAELRLPAPLLAVRCHAGTRDEDLALATRPELFTIGQPTFYGEENCRETLRKRGVLPDDLENWCVNSCMGLMIAGREFSDMWAVVCNCLPGLEAAMNGGTPFRPCGLSIDAPSLYGNIDELMETMLSYDRKLLRLLLEHHSRLNAEAFERGYHPSPFTSSLLRGGTPGADRLHGGPRYHTANVDLFALINTADALTAIDELVFRRKSRTLAEIAAAARSNFEGQEKLRQELLACPKFGNGNRTADAFAAKLAGRIARMIREENPDGGIYYMPSFHTLNVHVGRGANYPASCDGRRAGEPFSKNIGPMAGRNHEGISGLIRSAAAIGQTDFPGGQALDIYCDSALYRTEEARKKFRAALRTYFKLGGLQLQVNAVSIGELEKALEKPELYRDLTVRIGGYSTRFTSLPPKFQHEMIERFKHNA